MPKQFLILLLYLSCSCICAQDTIVLPSHGAGGIYTGCNGIIYDDGGTSNYADSTDSYIVLAPNWSTHVSVYFEEFDFEPVFDFVRIYDGPGLGYPLIGEYSGTQLLGQTVSSTGPYLTIRQKTDDIATYSGFKAIYSCTLGSEDIQSATYVIFPNPVEDFMQVQLPDNKLYSGYITDISGRQLLTFSSASNMATFSVSGLQAGTYFLTLFQPGNIPFCTRPFIKK